MHQPLTIVALGSHLHYLLIVSTQAELGQELLHVLSNWRKLPQIQTQQVQPSMHSLHLEIQHQLGSYLEQYQQLAEQQREFIFKRQQLEPFIKQIVDPYFIYHQQQIKQHSLIQNKNLLFENWR
ncbi:hypothetical protein TTHERM_000942775 (macronuclear) [Tetrahymena thermophila SB210]|uniref:Uncharacterized protein n=1 Tax=Tetrahymena thermophila (strain SB210) TaxID=312017 RepID=W7XL59_TETTS|nr:hypothetical protein TTHERM_000942775 [Tetrahymena thermophila SB210]EWS75719.1 hypothetical protein TTHERM_000942775 [Tetrahymena thermophila SB210]|eukprot:XP_012651742.1 hypothetical protein TTHERM_000942775 [Tetrahymena thermophila SB210]